MKNIKNISRRGIIRIISFASAIVVALGGAAYYGYVLSSNYKTELEYGYHRALNDLSDYIANIRLLLQKGSYATTSTALTQIAAELYSDTASAKCCVSRLPVNDEYMSGLNKFLSQAGEFSLELAKKTLRGDEISDEEKNTLKTLSETASSISTQIDAIQFAASDKDFRDSDVASDISQGEPTVLLQQMGENIERESEDDAIFPVLVYDGYYSDHIQGQEPKATEGKGEISEEAAKQTAANILGINLDNISAGNINDGEIPYYGFTCGDTSISITKKGGYLLYITNPRRVGSESISYNEAMDIARAYLQNLGLGNFSVNYYFVNEGVLTAAMSYIDTSGGQEVICYPDLINVGVALDTGEIVNYNASEYILSHQTRDMSQINHTADEAKEVLSSNLTPEKSNLCVIAVPGYIEVLCYEFVCTGSGGETVQVFINANNLEEEKILLRVETVGGNFYK